MLGQLDDAEKYLQRAIQTDGNLQAPHYNMVKVFLRRALQGQPIPDAAFVHAAKAIEIGPHTADLYRVVAALYARSGNAESNVDSAGYRVRGKGSRTWFQSRSIRFGPQLLRVAARASLP